MSAEEGSSSEEELYAWLNCVRCGGRWENCRYCPGLQSDPFTCQTCLGGVGIYIHHKYCLTQRTNCPVDVTDEKSCWWCKIHCEKRLVRREHRPVWQCPKLETFNQKLLFI